MIYELHLVHVIVKAVSLSLRALFSFTLNSIWLLRSLVFAYCNSHTSICLVQNLNFVNSFSEPLPVTNLTASPVGTTEMLLSWFYQRNNKSSYLYNVSVNGERLIQTSNETTQVSDLIPGNNYTFTVQAIVNGVISEPVAISAFTGITIHTLLKHISFILHTTWQFYLEMYLEMYLFHTFLQDNVYTTVLLNINPLSPPLLFCVIRAW